MTTAAEHITEQAFRETSVKLRKAGDVLIAMYAGATIGRTAILEFDATTNQAVCGCTPHDGVSARFLQYLLRAHRSELSAQGAGSAQANISKEKIVAFAVQLPPTAEQHRIVERIDELMALCDELEEQQAGRAEARSALTAATLQRVSEAGDAPSLHAAVVRFAERLDLHLAPGEGDQQALKRIRQAILDLAIEGRLTGRDAGDRPARELIAEIEAERAHLVTARAVRKPKLIVSIDASFQEFAAPDGWSWCRLGELILSSDSGWSPSCIPERRTSEEQWSVLKVSAVSWGTFRANEHKVLTPGLEPRPQLEVKDGDFIMSRANTAELVGRSVVASDPPPRLMLSDKHVRLRFRDRITAEYANLVNGSTRARRHYAAVASGTSDSMRNVTRDQILALPVMLPPLSEQVRIVRLVAEMKTTCDDLERKLETARMLRGTLAASIGSAVGATV